MLLQLILLQLILLLLAIELLLTVDTSLLSTTFFVLGEIVEGSSIVSPTSCARIGDPSARSQHTTLCKGSTHRAYAETKQEAHPDTLFACMEG